MTRLLPAHVVMCAAAVGLAASNALRVELAPTAMLGVGALGAALVALAPPGARVVLLALVLVAAGWWWGSVRLDALDRSPMRAEVATAGPGRAVVTGEARVGQFEQRIPARLESFDGRHVGERVQLELPLGRAPPQGAIVQLDAVVSLPRGPDAHGFDERRWLRRQGVHVVLKVDGWQVVGARGGIAGAADRLRAWLRRSSAPGLTGERRAVLEGVVLGDEAGLSTGLQTSFRRSGLFHLLAVSGQNVVLLGAGVLGLVWLLGLSRAVGHLAALVAIGGYVLAVGPQPSVIRAAVSGVAVSVAWLTSRERDPWHVLALAAVVLLGTNPYTLFDPGFQLSFAAVLAIFVAVPPLLRLLEGYPVHPKLAAAVAISAACSVATAPILWLQFGQVPLLGVLANALVEPVVGPLLGLALVTAAVDPVSPSLAAGLASLDGYLAAYVAGCARAISAVPFAQATGQAAALAAAGAFCVSAYALRRWRTSSSLPT